MLKIHHLTKKYGPNRGVQGISLELRKGECFGFIGPNGAGKSTTIRSIMNMLNYQEGKIFLETTEMNRKHEMLKEKIGYLPSEIYLYDELTVEKMFAYSASFYQKDCKKRTRELIRRFQIDPKKKIEELSLGNLKKVGIVLALMHEPELLILDEATSGLDPLMQEEFYKILEEEKKKGTTIFFSSHILSELKRICDRVGIIRDGVLIKVEEMDQFVAAEFQIVTIDSPDHTQIQKKCPTILETKENQLKFIWKKSPNELFTFLAQYQISKIVIEDPSMEELFMHYYKEESHVTKRTKD